MLFGKLSSSIGGQKIRKGLFLHQKTGSLNSSRIFILEYVLECPIHVDAQYDFGWVKIDGFFLKG